MIIKNHHVAVATAGGVVIAAGVVSGVQMVFGFLSGWFMLNLGILAIPIGIAILKGSRNARAVALIFSAIIGGMISLGSGVAAYRHFIGSDPLSLVDAIYLAILISLGLAASGMVFVLMRRRDVTEWFFSEGRTPSDTQSHTIPLLLIAGGLATAWFAQSWWASRTLEAAYAIRVEVIPYDDETNDGLHSIGPVTTGTDRRGLPLPTPTVTMISSLDIGSSPGMELRIEGIAARPLPVTIEAEGYEPARIVIDRTAPPRLRVGMKRTASAPEPDRRTADARGL